MPKLMRSTGPTLYCDYQGQGPAMIIWPDDGYVGKREMRVGLLCGIGISTARRRGPFKILEYDPDKNYALAHDLKRGISLTLHYASRDGYAPYWRVKCLYQDDWRDS